MEEIFQSIRKFTVSVFIAAVGLLLVIGILAIWDIVDASYVGKSFQTLLLIAISTGATYAVSNENYFSGHGKPMSLTLKISLVLLALIAIPFILSRLVFYF